jgi:cell wall-associated NlpC family hydrolase
MAAVVSTQEDGVLYSSPLPVTVAVAGPAETAAPLPSLPPAPTDANRNMMAAAAAVPTATEPAPAPSPPPLCLAYTVQDGDTIDALAATYGVSSGSILGSNPQLQDADSLTPGQSLRIPTSEGIVYDVVSGDTLSDIAARFGVDVQAIIDFPGNNLNGADVIAEGQTIFIPGGTMPEPVATPTPEPASTPAPAYQPPPLPLPSPPRPGDASGLGAQAAELARSRIGAPYVPGAAGPNGFDCSGLVYWVYSQLGLPVPRTAPQQYAWTVRVESSDMQPGDIVFFQNTFPSSDWITHVGIYVGGGGVVMAVDNGDIVREVSLSESYWSDHFAGAGRPP